MKKTRLSNRIKVSFTIISRNLIILTLLRAKSRPCQIHYSRLIIQNKQKIRKIEFH